MRKWAPLLTVCLATLMLLVDITIVSVAIPAMTTSLNSSLSALQWTVDLYVLVLAALLMAAGSVSDLVGRRKVYLVGLVVFALASLACGLATDSAFLIAARGVQGFGAATMLSTNIALLANTYEGKERSIAFGVWGAVNGISAAAGPILGGALTQYVGWRWIFLINLPVAAVALLLAWRYVRESRDPRGGRLDVPGTITFTAAATLVIYGLIRVGEDGWSSPTPLVMFAGAIVALVVFVLVERRAAHPMVDLAVVRTSSFGALMLGALVLSGTAFAALVFVSIWAQTVLHMSAVQAGLVLTPLGLTAFFVSGIFGRVMNRIAPRWPIGIGLLLIGVGSLLDMLVTPESSWTALLPGLLVAGAGVGLSSPTLASAAAAAAPASKAGMAGGAVNTLRQLGFALGIPIMTSVLSASIRPILGNSGHFTDLDTTTEMVAGGQSDDVLATLPAAARTPASQAIRDAYTSGLDSVFLLSGVCALVTGVIVLLLVRRASHESEPEPVGKHAAHTA
ncbi:MFS transporter [Streptoalloteichus hindustanus]|uniref:Drug resistance transporter, EmrB/QacA subfamily n=1 Tax=Streptoalloteichus hindustanus TaxID=2017 RepID=A0A1M5EWY0_STRHI|nr:MFS transporter [Streptoalloteichus hindustanus]SHF83636.1 drug resistance transporter, EmrB/QacA subfamily [Streptoalloteichus hindustanus]